MWSKAFIFSFFCQIYISNAEFGQFPTCKWDVHNCGHVEVICGGIKETVHLDAKHSNRSHDLTKYLHHPSTVSSRQQSLEQCFAIRDDDKGKFGNYEIEVDIMSFESISGINCGHLGLIFNYRNEMNYDFVFLEVENATNARFTSGYRLEGSYVFGENVRIIQSFHGTKYHSLRLVVDNNSLNSTKVFLDGTLIGSVQEHFVSRLKGGVFVLNSSGSVGLFKNFRIKECNQFYSNGECSDVYATWNDEVMTLRSGDVNDPFTIANGESWNGNMHYYTNLPFDVQRRFPMYGTTDINSGDANVLVLNRKMISFLLRHRSWNNVPLDGWKLVSSGNYLGPLITDGNIDLYQKTFSKGTYIIDNNSGMYLFSDVLDGQ